MNYEEKLKEKFEKTIDGLSIIRVGGIFTKDLNIQTEDDIKLEKYLKKELKNKLLPLFSQSLSDYKKELGEEILDIKVTDEPDEKEFSTLTKGKIFQAGQMNILFRLRKKISLLQKDKEVSK